MKQARNELIKLKHKLEGDCEIDGGMTTSDAIEEINNINYTLDVFDTIERRSIGKPDEDEMKRLESLDLHNKD